MNSNNLKSLITVIVLYETKITDSATYKSLDSALVHFDSDLDLIIYDNSNIAHYDQRTFHLNKFRITYFHDADNPGVSKAYNVAASYAQRLKKNWILLLDQDTSFDVNIFHCYQESIEMYPDVKLFAPILKLSSGEIFSPCRYLFKRGFHLKSIKPGIHSLKNMSPVNSGMLIDLNCFVSVGGYNEKVKLDFSDFQFIERFRSQVNKFVVVNSTAFQDFSDSLTEIDQKLNRYRIYCECARSCDVKSTSDLLQYSLVTFLRALKLILKFKSHKFIIVWINTFVLKKRD